MSDADTPPDEREELAALAGDLETVLRDLRDEIEPDRQRGPFGLPRPPDPSQVIQFADEVAIPATIAVLEANVKLLQALQRAIRMTESGRQVREEGSAVGDRAADISRSTLDRLGSTLEELQAASERTTATDGSPGEELIEEARRLRDEIDRRLRDAQGTTTLDDFENADGDDGDEATELNPDEEAESSATEVPVDVEAELDSLKDEYGEDEAT
ncbi:MAG: hypothetical protein ACI9PP_002378, partial [Halobacteriales archaeon]